MADRFDTLRIQLVVTPYLQHFHKQVHFILTCWLATVIHVQYVCSMVLSVYLSIYVLRVNSLYVSYPSSRTSAVEQIKTTHVIYRK